MPCLRDELAVADDELIGGDLRIAISVERAELNFAHADRSGLALADHTILVSVRVRKHLARAAQGVGRRPCRWCGGLRALGCVRGLGGT